ncbi:MAG: hypothetical protein IIB38_11175, partial [Candidatus Hydrogenedentes bacterium]|nr:hypothetical protein [Candidatus Hydrogenedentota bacterium]
MKFLITALAFVMAGSVFAEDAEDTDDIVVVCPIEGMIDEGIVVIVKRAIKEARELDAKAIIFRVNTPGGRVDSAVNIAAAIGGAHCPTLAYIEGMGAISAGALISFSCDDMVMTPGSNIGAATPVIPSPQGMLPTSEKEVSFMRAKMRALAEANGHNPHIAHAMVDKEIELRGYTAEDGTYHVYSVENARDGSTMDAPAETDPDASPLKEFFDALKGDLPDPTGDTLSPTAPPVSKSGTSMTSSEPGTVVYEDGSELVLASGKLLTLTPKEALKYGVIDFIVDDLDEAAGHFDLDGARLHVIEFNWAERFYRFMTNPTVAGLLLMLGMGGLYFEVKTPGFGIPGIIALTCLTLLFGSHYVLGLTDAGDLILILAGIILILVEIFAFPGFGIPGVAGIICLILGFYLAMVDFKVPEYSWQFDRLNEVAYSLFVALASFAVLVGLTWRYLPRTRLYGALVMGETQQVSEGFVMQTEEDTSAALGLEGTASSMLRPAGRGR